MPLYRAKNTVKNDIKLLWPLSIFFSFPLTRFLNFLSTENEKTGKHDLHIFFGSKEMPFFTLKVAKLQITIYLFYAGYGLGQVQ